jgi:hypothetical protein
MELEVCDRHLARQDERDGPSKQADEEQAAAEHDLDTLVSTIFTGPP